MGNLFNSVLIKKTNSSLHDINYKPKDIFGFCLDGKKKDAKDAGQDSHIFFSYTMNSIIVKCFGVFDGHGKHGKKASQFAAKQVEEYIKYNKQKLIYWDNTETITDKFTQLFNEIQFQMIKKPEYYEWSGTCAVLVIAINLSIYTINLGDSRAVLGALSNQTVYTIDLSNDHKPNEFEETDRIERSGGEVISSIKESNNNDSKSEKLVSNITTHRIFKKGEVLPGLAVARTLGDLLAHDIGVSHIPQVSYKIIDNFDFFVIIGSDGIFDVMSSIEICCFIFETLKTHPTDVIPELLVKECRSRWETLNKVKLQVFTDEIEDIKNKNGESNKEINKNNNPNNDAKENLPTLTNVQNNNNNGTGNTFGNNYNHAVTKLDYIEDETKHINELVKSFKETLSIDDITSVIYFIDKEHGS